jgi:eukaryotic-like serine/threonine-protein kinase
LLTQWDHDEKAELWLLPLTGARKPSRLFSFPFQVRHGEFSPDGRWIAYVSDENGRPEVYVHSFPSASTRWQVSNGGGEWPRWRGDSAELFYISADRKLISVHVRDQRSIPQPLFPVAARAAYAVSRDGQRFLMRTRAPGATAPPIHVTVDWTADLRR